MGVIQNWSLVALSHGDMNRGEIQVGGLPLMKTFGNSSSTDAPGSTEAYSYRPMLVLAAPLRREGGTLSANSPSFPA
ncbi:hypothetical protein NL676_019926 [Syzygium grande]|nr:hypothetical protein NL676_019926 [Syzygium grande]